MTAGGGVVTGSRDRLKTDCPSGRVGSNPTRRTRCDQPKTWLVCASWRATRRLPRRRDDLPRPKTLLSAAHLHGQPVPGDHRRGRCRDARGHADQRRDHPTEASAPSRGDQLLRKHERTIELAPWQEAIVDREPEQFIGGLIHSDGCRTTNRVTVGGKRYAHPRSFFWQVSKDIQELFCRSCPPAGHRIHLQRRPRARGLGRPAQAALPASIPSSGRSPESRRQRKQTPRA
jgi:hypothetical protein